MKRKIITLALIVSIIMMNIIPIVNASSKVDVTLTTSKSTIEQGDTFTLAVILSEGNISSYGIKVLFDSNAVECTSSSENGITIGSNYVIVSNSSTSNNLSGDTVASINFKAKDNASVGTKTFTIDSSDTVIKRIDEGDVTGSFGGASINIIEKYVPSSNVNLKFLEVNKGTLAPSFDENVTSYVVNVDKEVESIVLSAGAEDSKAKISGTGTKKLVIGNNLFTIIVTAEDGTTKEYQLNIKRSSTSKSSNTNLKTLKANRNDILLSKTLTVKNTVSSVEIVAEAEDEKAKISGDIGIKNLQVGKNTFKITVTAENGDITVYEIVITRSEAETVKTPSANANLRSLLVDGTVVTGFSPVTHTYEVRVDKNKTTAVISAVKDDDNATLLGVGTVSLDNGTNTFMVRVIAENGKTNNIYILNIIRGGKAYTASVQAEKENSEAQVEEVKPEANNYLKSLEVNQGVLSPVFKKDVSLYTLVVGMDVKNIDVTALPDYEKATVEVMGNTDIKEGLNNITIIVTAEDGTKRVYTINVTKTNNLELANANLQSIIIDGTELLPEFVPDVLEYTCAVEEGITSLDIVALAVNENAKVEITGNQDLVPGENIINIIVTAEDGITTKTYVIKAIKAGELPEEVEVLTDEELNDIEETNLPEEKEEKSNIGLIITLIIATYAVGILAIILVYKREKELNESTVEKKVELLEKGKDALNKDKKASDEKKSSKSEKKNEKSVEEVVANKSKENAEKEEKIDDEDKNK